MIIQKKISRSPGVIFIFNYVLNHLYSSENEQDWNFFS